MLRDIRQMASEAVRAKRGIKSANEVEELRDWEGWREGDQSRWSQFAHDDFDRKYRGVESIERQRDARWQSAAG